MASSFILGSKASSTYPRGYASGAFFAWTTILSISLLEDAK